MSTIENLQWRYATKRYDPAKKLSDEQREIIMEALRLSPSSFGLQPWKFIHVTDMTTREKLKAAAWNQVQLTEASDVFIICGLLNIDEAYVETFVQATAEQRGMKVEDLKGYRDMMIGSIKTRSVESNRDWCARQAYLAMGVALAAAAENHIDASPMEGFDPKKFDEILDLSAMGYQSLAILAVGFRSPEDSAQHFKKVRLSRNDVMKEV